MPETRIHSLDGSSLPAYLASPQGKQGSGVIVIHGTRGLDEEMRALCEDLASNGFFALCPDLFARQRSAGLDPSSFYLHFDVESGLRDLLAALAHLRKETGCNGKVGALGFCIGGKLAFLMATRSDIDCSVGYDNVGIDELVNEIFDIRAPLLLHFGEQDILMPESSRQKALRFLEQNGLIQTYLYADAGHAFALKNSDKYDADARACARKRTLDFLTDNLKA